MSIFGCRGCAAKDAELARTIELLDSLRAELAAAREQHAKREDTLLEKTIALADLNAHARLNRVPPERPANLRAVQPPTRSPQLIRMTQSDRPATDGRPEPAGPTPEQIEETFKDNRQP